LVQPYTKKGHAGDIECLLLCKDERRGSKRAPGKRNGNKRDKSVYSLGSERVPRNCHSWEKGSNEGAKRGRGEHKRGASHLPTVRWGRCLVGGEKRTLLDPWGITEKRTEGRGGKRIGEETLFGGMFAVEGKKSDVGLNKVNLLVMQKLEKKKKK